MRIFSRVPGGGVCLTGALAALLAWGSFPTVTIHAQNDPRGTGKKPPTPGEGSGVQEFPSPNAGRQAPPPKKGSTLDIATVIERFAAKESEFRAARADYVYRQEVRMNELGLDDRPVGEFYRVSEINFSESGQRREVIKKFPPSTLRGVNITPADLEDFGITQPFSLTKEELPNYYVEYVNKERIDEINAYVFDVRPRQVPKFTPNGKRLFSGRIWVDDRDLLIVKTDGKTLPEDKNNKFPRFQSYRENIDGKYWFPTYVYADDVLPFENNPVHIRLEIRYTNYKQYRTDVQIVD